MWQRKCKLENGLIEVNLDRDFNIAHSFYDSEYIKDVSAPILELISLKGEMKTLWHQRCLVGASFFKVFFGGIYCSWDNINLYRVNEEGFTLFLEGVTDGRFIGDDVYVSLNGAGNLVAHNVFDKKKMWEYAKPDDKKFIDYYFPPVSADFLALVHEDYNGFDVLDPKNGNHLWALAYPDQYKYNSSVVVGQYLFLLLECKDLEKSDVISTHYIRDLYIFKKSSGEIIKIFKNVPGYSKIFYHENTGKMYICGGESLYSLDPFSDNDFACHPITIDGVEEIYLQFVIGCFGRDIVMFSNRFVVGENSTPAIVHFDTHSKAFSYAQALDPFFSRRRNIEARDGFLFISDRDGAMNIFEWVFDN